LKAGWTYRVAQSKPGFDASRHLWIILSDPDLFPDEILAVFMTSLRPRMDQTCILEVGDHPFITHKTTIAYSSAVVWTRDAFSQALADGDILLQEPIDDSLLARIRFLALASPRLNYAHQQIASNQGFRLGPEQSGLVDSGDSRRLTVDAGVFNTELMANPRGCASRKLV